MGAVVGVVAFVIALVGLLAAAGNLAYLALLNNAAKKRGISGAPVSDYTRKMMNGAGATTGAALVGFLLVSVGNVPVDVIGMLLAGGAGLVGAKALNGTRERFRTQL